MYLGELLYMAIIMKPQDSTGEFFFFFFKTFKSVRSHLAIVLTSIMNDK
jgi:hypothetical protein